MLAFCLLLLPLWDTVIVLCFVIRYVMSILLLQLSWWGRESWLLCLICLPGVSWWLSGSSSQCHGVVCGLWLWYFLIILTYYFCLWCLYIIDHSVSEVQYLFSPFFSSSAESSVFSGESVCVRISVSLRVSVWIIMVYRICYVQYFLYVSVVGIFEHLIDQMLDSRRACLSAGRLYCLYLLNKWSLLRM